MKAFISTICFILFSRFSCVLLDSPSSSDYHSVGPGGNHFLQFENLKTSKQFFNRHRVQKLNDAFIPIHYDIELRVIIDKDEEAGLENSAPGKVKIYGINQKNTTRIVLNAGTLQVNESSIKIFSQGQLLSLKRCLHKPQANLFVIELENEIGPGGKLEICMEYIAKLNSHFIGIRRKDYADDISGGGVKKLIFTNLQALRAQDNGLDATLHRASFCYSVFPCFDEPHLKATYELTIIRKVDQVSLSNAELLTSVPDSQFDGWVVDKFARTIRISPHFFMFVIGEFGYVEEYFGINGKKLRIYAPKHHIHKTQFKYVAQVSANVLTFYEKYFNSSANLTKMELVFAPTYDLLESWGLSYHGYRVSKQGFMTRGGGIVIPKGNHSTDFSVLDSISPVLAKQWTGDWWNSETMSLSEALAEFTEFFLGWNIVEPRLSEARVMVELQSALMKDADFLKVQQDYRRKGAPLIKMMEGILTKEGLRNGLRAYVQETVNGNSITTQTFIQILQDVAGNCSQVPPEFSFVQVAERFLNNTGFPLVKVAVENKTHFILTQEKFLSNEKGAWYVPIEVQIGMDAKVKVWLKPDGKPVHVAGNTSEVILIDPNVDGYYRVLYQDKLLQRIKTQLGLRSRSILRPLARSKLLLDYLTFADKSVSNYDTALTLSNQLGSGSDTESSNTVWLALLWKLRSDVVRPFLAHPDYPTLHTYFASKIDPLLYEIENEAPSPYVTFLRHWLLRYSCQYRTSYCLNLAQNVFSLWQATPNSSLSSFSTYFTGISVTTMECLIVAAEGKAAFRFILTKYKNKKLPESLTCTRDFELIQLMLNNLIDPLDSSLTPKLRKSMLTNLMDNDGRVEVLPFLSNNFDAVVEVVGGGDVHIMMYSLYHLVDYYYTSEQLKELSTFLELYRTELEAYNYNNGKKLVNKLYELVEKNIAWMDTKGMDILEWLHGHQTVDLNNNYYFENN